MSTQNVVKSAYCTETHFIVSKVPNNDVCPGDYYYNITIHYKIVIQLCSFLCSLNGKKSQESTFEYI